jgi:hypothetical protein
MAKRNDSDRDRLADYVTSHFMPMARRWEMEPPGRYLEPADRERLIADVEEVLRTLADEGVMEQLAPGGYWKLKDEPDTLPQSAERIARGIWPKAFEAPYAGGYQRWEDAMVAQARLYEFCTSYEGEQFYTHFQHSLNGQHPISSQLSPGFLRLLHTEMLRDADPIYVSADITDIVDDARHDFEVEPVLASDPFVNCGFALFPRAIDMHDAPRTPDKPYRSRDGIMPIRAISWMPVHSEDRSQGVFWISFWAHVDDDIGHYDEEGRGIGNGITREDLIRLHGPLALSHTFQWTWGSRPTPGKLAAIAVEGEDPDMSMMRATEQSATVQTFWRLGQQFTVGKQRAPRQIWRDTSRKLRRDVRDVNVVVLRRTRPGEDPLIETDRHYHVTFPVRGHWRWQHTREGQRQVWVRPHIKGQGPWIGERKRAWEFRR